MSNNVILCGQELTMLPPPELTSEMKANIKDATRNTTLLPESIPNVDYPCEKPKYSYYTAIPSTHRYGFMIMNKKIMQKKSTRF